MRWSARSRDERGVAMITAILVLAVIVLIAAVSMTLSTHTVRLSGRDRSRALAIHASEAGIDRFLLYLDQVPADDVECDPLGVQAMPTSPQATYAVTAVYDVGCPPTSPSSVVIRSVGKAGGVTRTMESFVRLRDGGGSLGNDAIYSDDPPEFSGNTKVLGNSESPDKADLYSNGSVALSGNSVIWGSVKTRRTFAISGSFEVKRNVYALGSGESSGPASLQVNAAAKVWGSVYNSTGSVSINGNGAEVKGDASACTIVTLSSGGNLGGSQLPGVCPNPPLPLPEAYPVYTYDPTEWTEAGYTINTFSGTGTTPCTDAKAFIQGVTSGKHVVRVDATCEVKFTQSVNVSGNLAIITSGNFIVTGNSTIGDPTGTPRDFYLMACMPRSDGTSVPDGTLCIQAEGGATFGSSLTTLIYTPQKKIIDLRGNAYTQRGQVIGGTVKFRGDSALTYWGISVPGMDDAHFRQDIAYIREIVN